MQKKNCSKILRKEGEERICAKMGQVIGIENYRIMELSWKGLSEAIWSGSPALNGDTHSSISAQSLIQPDLEGFGVPPPLWASLGAAAETMGRMARLSGDTIRSCVGGLWF